MNPVYLGLGTASQVRLPTLRYNDRYGTESRAGRRNRTRREQAACARPARMMIARPRRWLGKARADVEEYVVYAMRGRLAMLMDIHCPERSNEFDIVFVPGSGWRTPLTYDASPPKASGFAKLYVPALTGAGYTVFVINHRAVPRSRYPTTLGDAQRAVRYVRHYADPPQAHPQGPAEVPGCWGHCR